VINQKKCPLNVNQENPIKISIIFNADATTHVLLPSQCTKKIFLEWSKLSEIPLLKDKNNISLLKVEWMVDSVTKGILVGEEKYVHQLQSDQIIVLPTEINDFTVSGIDHAINNGEIISNQNTVSVEPLRSSSFGPQYDGNNRGKNGIEKGDGIDSLESPCVYMIFRYVHVCMYIRSFIFMHIHYIKCT
jgi:hypothetical protein